MLASGCQLGLWTALRNCHTLLSTKCHPERVTRRKEKPVVALKMELRDETQVKLSTEPLAGLKRADIKPGSRVFTRPVRASLKPVAWEANIFTL